MSILYKIYRKSQIKIILLKLNIWIDSIKIYNYFDVLFFLYHNMPKRIKITLYVILILVIIAVIWLMFWNKNLRTETPTDKIEISTWNNIINFEEPDLTTDTNSATFEDDVMKDLEWFFNDNKGYEDVQWEYWFTNPENE